MTQNTPPTGDNELLGTAVAMRKITRLERFLGPDNYRILQGLFKTPVSIAGFTLLTLFILVAIFAPVLAPPVTPNDPYKIPRDGFKSQPREPGSEWTKNVPEIPFWYKAVTGNEEWVHLFGTAQGQYDIYYGVIWGTRTAFYATPGGHDLCLIADTAAERRKKCGDPGTVRKSYLHEGWTIALRCE